MQWRRFLSKPAPWLGIIGALLTSYGAIAVTELTSRADAGQKFLTTGTPAVADHVSLEVGIGRGAPGLRDVQVQFKSASRQNIRTHLVWIDQDTHITRNAERQTPDPGSRYAPPLKILYLTHDPQEAIAEADAQRLITNRDQYRRWAAACLGVGLASLGALSTVLVRQKRASRPVDQRKQQSR